VFIKFLFVFGVAAALVLMRHPQGVVVVAVLLWALLM
jgi:hypothetical protein